MQAYQPGDLYTVWPADATWGIGPNNIPVFTPASLAQHGFEPQIDDKLISPEQPAATKAYQYNHFVYQFLLVSRTSYRTSTEFFHDGKVPEYTIPYFFEQAGGGKGYSFRVENVPPIPGWIGTGNVYASPKSPPKRFTYTESGPDDWGTYYYTAWYEQDVDVYYMFYQNAVQPKAYGSSILPVITMGLLGTLLLSSATATDGSNAMSTSRRRLRRKS
jgi:hypothetical protein